MEIMEVAKKGKSIISENLHLSYNINIDADGEVRDIHGAVVHNDTNVGFVSHNFARRTTNYNLNQDNGLEKEEIKSTFGVFMDDVEQLSS